MCWEHHTASHGRFLQHPSSFIFHNHRTRQPGSSKHWKLLTLGVAASTFRLDTGRPQVHGSLQSLQATVETAIRGRPLLFTTAFSSIHYSLIIPPNITTQPTLFVRGFVHHGFAYSCKNYCGSPHASLANSRQHLRNFAVLIHNRPHPFACFTQPLLTYNRNFHIFHPTYIKRCQGRVWEAFLIDCEFRKNRPSERHTLITSLHKFLLYFSNIFNPNWIYNGTANAQETSFTSVNFVEVGTVKGILKLGA